MSKRSGIRILNAHILNENAKPFTSRGKALKYLAEGRARYVDEHTIEMVENDYRHLAASPERQVGDRLPPRPATSNSPMLQLVPWRPVDWTDAPHQTFLHYPQRNQTSTRRLRRAA